MSEDTRIEYQLKIFTYPPAGNEGAIIARVEEAGLEAFKRQMNDPKVRFMEIPVVMPEKFIKDDEPYAREQTLFLKQDNFFAFYVTPIDVAKEIALIEKERKEKEEAMEEAKKQQEADKKEIMDKKKVEQSTKE